MAEVAQDAAQDFWRSPGGLEPAVETTLSAAASEMAEACADCGTEFMIGARFCHTCGLRRPALADDSADAAVMAGLWTRTVTWSVARARSGSASVAAAWRKISFPDWMQYLHFHEIKRWIGFPTAPAVGILNRLGGGVGS